MRIYTVSVLLALGVSSGSAWELPVSRDIGTILSGLLGSASEQFTSHKYQLERFWEEAQKIGPQAAQVVLNEVSKISEEVASAVVEFQNATMAVVQHAHQLRSDIQEKADKEGFTFEHVSELFLREISGVYEDLKSQINDPLPQDHDQKAKARARIANQVMDKVQAAYVVVLTEIGLHPEETEGQLKELSSGIIHVLLVMGNIMDKHPIIFESLVFAATMLFLPEIQILRPIMTLLGFGPLGPIKGSPAAWAQRLFFGGVIPAGNWFAILQRVGMTLTGSWLQKLAASAGLAAVLGLMGDDRKGL